MTDWTKLREDLAAAREAAELAAQGDDGGSSNFDDVRLFGVRWSKRAAGVAEEAGLRARRATWLRRACISLELPGTGQGHTRTRAAEALARVLRGRGWDASVFYMAD
ncbi:MAG: hypothetical protein RLO52_34590 [Sandaracinaceae bacterium]